MKIALRLNSAPYVRCMDIETNLSDRLFVLHPFLISYKTHWGKFRALQSAALADW